MNRNKVFNFQLLGMVFTIILGTIAHFFYTWSGGSNIVALFCPVNESTWEHLKLIFFPMVIFDIIEYFYITKEVNNLLEAKCIGVIMGMISITVIFYTYTGIIGENFFVIDIMTFVLSVVLAECIEYKVMTSKKWSNKITQVLSIICVILIAIMFFIYTFNTPNIPLFLDPITDNYGILYNSI